MAATASAALFTNRVTDSSVVAAPWIGRIYHTGFHAQWSESGYAGDMRKTSAILWQDAQHQVLFEILDLIAQPDAGTEVLRQLYDYSENHFAMEEHYMVAMDYPETGTHIQAHDQFRTEISSLLGLQVDDPEFRAVVSTFLTEWLKRHVLGVDKDLEAFILASDVK
jgi:hemerythrin